MRLSATRPGRKAFRGLASTACVLILAGLSCKYNVTLPWVPGDASTRVSEDTNARVQDSSFDTPADTSTPPPPDVSISRPDARVCTGSTKEKPVQRVPGQILVAIDRSAPMQRDKSFDSGTKLSAATAAWSNAVDHHTWLGFPIFWFPGMNCGPGCCASFGGRGGFSDGTWGCGPSDAGCAAASNDSPSHQALKLISSNSDRYLAFSNTTIVLITDQASSCANESGSAACDTAVSEAGNLGERGIRVFVIIPSSDGRQVPDCLHRIANQNARNFTDAEHLFVTKTSTEVSTQLDRIASDHEKRLCSFYVTDMVRPEDIDQIKINDSVIPRDNSGQTGWRLANDSILLSPDECKKTWMQTPSIKAVICNSGPGGQYGN